jgi:tRNA_anti-like
MAMIACKECGHQISEKAVSCPNCGAPSVPAARHDKPRPLRRALYALFVVFATLWLVGAAFWIARTLGSSNQPLSAASEPGEAQPPLTKPTSPPSQAVSSSPTPGDESSAAPRLVYQTTAEQLYQDYSANGVATQSRIGNSRVRVTGNVAEIDEDASGHPVIKLAAGAEGSADLTLTTDQTSAAGQLVKGESVEIECDRMQRFLAAPRGSRCALVLVDARSKQVYLGVFLANDTGTAPVYVVGPMSESACQSRSDSISSQLSMNRRGDRVDLKDCAFATRESVPVGGCRLASFAPAAPEMPTAHLWKYDCTPASETSQLAATTEAHAKRRSAAAELALAPASPAPAVVSSQQGPTERVAAGFDDQQVPAPRAAPPPPPHLTLASAATPSQGAGDDLSIVRAVDPQAAQRIVSYCDTASASAAERAAFAAACRRNESDAYTRLVLRKEFPAEDDAMRRKCSEAPFPDSYVAKELCAKYELHLD